MDIYIFEDLRDPLNSSAVTSIRQLEDKTSLDERTLGRRFKQSPLYFDPKGRFRLLKLELIKDKRKGNGDPENFNQGGNKNE